MLKDLLYDFISFVGSIIIVLVVGFVILFVGVETVDYIHSHHEIPYCPPDPTECN